MPYTYLEEIAIADIAFQATGRSVEELFTAAADATVNVMVEDLAAIRDRQRRQLRMENDALDLLLFDFLNEFVYLRDAKGLLMRVASLSIVREPPHFALTGELYGEPIDPARHSLAGDVKAVTLHRFSLVETDAGWEATVILDI
jgi:SHS2 domain-containing protein